jgi:hypothetical protein
MFKLPKFAKAIAGAVALAGSTALGFLPHTDPWFNILTGVVAVLGIYGIYAIPNKVLAEDVLGLLGKVLPADVVAKIAPLVQSVVDAVDPAPAPVPAPVPNPAAPVSEPQPIPPVAAPADATVTPAAGQ